MPEMTLDDYRARKQRLKEEVMEAVQDFRADTGEDVTTLRLDTADVRQKDGTAIHEPCDIEIKTSL